MSESVSCGELSLSPPGSREIERVKRVNVLAMFFLLDLSIFIQEGFNLVESMMTLGMVASTWRQLVTLCLQSRSTER